MLAQTKISVAPGRPSEFPADLIRRVSIAVYIDRLGPKDAALMMARDGDGGIKLAERSVALDALTRAYLRAIGSGA